jgi:acyl carrier protein
MQRTGSNLDHARAAAEITDIIREELDCRDISLAVDTVLADIPGWDSVSMSCIMIAIERQFGFEFVGNEADRLTDFDSLVTITLAKTS